MIGWVSLVEKSGSVYCDRSFQSPPAMHVARKENPKNQKCLQDVSADEKGRLIPAVAHYWGTSTAESNTTTRKIRRIVELLEEIH